jgi:hypothetical protein
MTRLGLIPRLLLSLLAMAGIAGACPDPVATPSVVMAFTGRALWMPQVMEVAAGGDGALGRCGFARHGLVRGPPDFAFDLSRMRRYDRLHLRANAPCDTVLLVRDPGGRWFFDDDSGTGHTASLSLSGPTDGAYLVWVGTWAPEGCTARLTLETF